MAQLGSCSSEPLRARASMPLAQLLAMREVGIIRGHGLQSSAGHGYEYLGGRHSPHPPLWDDPLRGSRGSIPEGGVRVPGRANLVGPRAHSLATLGQGCRIRSSPRCRTATAPARLSGSATVARSLTALSAAAADWSVRRRRTMPEWDCRWVGADVAQSAAGDLAEGRRRRFEGLRYGNTRLY